MRTMRLAVSVLVVLWAVAQAGAMDFKKPPVLSVKGYQLYADGQPVRGVFYMWHAGQVNEKQNEAFYRAEFRRMKAMGVVGVGIEIGWNAIEPKDGEFDFKAEGQDQFIRWAQDEGLWVHLLFTPHYTPGWLFTKYGDIKMKNADGKDTDGSFLTFSPHSPAVEDQIRFQQECVKHYSQFNNVLAFFLTNEQSYGDWVDYSKWGQEAFRRWLEKVNPKIGFWNDRWGTHYEDFAKAELPASDKDGRRWEDWLRFRVDAFVEYQNRLYDGAVKARTRFIPIAHKWIPYNALDANANRSGLKYSPASIRSDLFTEDAYGQNGLMYACALSYGKPMALAESNLAGGHASAEEMLSYVLDQYFHGIQIVTI